MRLRHLLFLTVLVLAAVIAVAAVPGTVRYQPERLPDRDLTAPTAAPALPVMPVLRDRSLDDPIGTLDTAGTTWWDEQQWTTCGKLIAVDADGYVHTAWTKGMTSTPSGERHVYYNLWSPQTSAFVFPTEQNPVGVRVDNAAKAGYTTMAVNSAGRAYVAFHQSLTSGASRHSAVGADFGARVGAFVVNVIPYPDDNMIIYPKIACDIHDSIHVTATFGTPVNFGYYARGHALNDTIDWGNGFLEEDSTYFLTRDIATSFHSNRVAMAYLYWPSTTPDQFYGPNLYLRVSSDGGQTWDVPINVTNFPVIDTNCVVNGGNPVVCSQDTLRPSYDLSVIFDQNDIIHVAFTTRWMSPFDETGTFGPWVHGARESWVWHWDELRQEFNFIAGVPYGSLDRSPGAYQMMCQKPSLAVDTTTGYLYCSYQQFDTTQYSSSGFLQADAYVSVSTTGGRTWSVGTNVTNTAGGQDAPAGQCRHERDINIARFATGGFVHMQYQLDLDAGTGINAEPEGSTTDNPVIYQRIPVDQIPVTPLMPYMPLRYDSTGYPAAVTDCPNLLPGQFALYQNYPNPFNPTTTIQFDLASQSTVSLKVFDVLGQEVATLLDRAALPAGTQVVSFDAAGLSSGIYFYRLETSRLSQTRKMVVMK